MELWLLYAFGASVFAGLTTILAKIGLQHIDSHLATAIRTLVVLAFAWLMVFVAGSQHDIWSVAPRTWIFLILSGLATGGSWLCFFRALQLGHVNQVVPIDKSSTIFTMILAFLFLREPLSPTAVFGMALIGIGTWLMIERRLEPIRQPEKGSRSWLLFAVLAAVFASLTAILGHIGIAEIEANLGTAIRTLAVVPVSWLMVFVSGSTKKQGSIDRKGWFFLVLSGIATGISWLFFYHALQIGHASLVVPIDKLSVVFTMAFAHLYLKERFSTRVLFGLVLLVVGTLLPVLL